MGEKTCKMGVEYLVGPENKGIASKKTTMEICQKDAGIS